jgi:hypothetical protein
MLTARQVAASLAVHPVTVSRLAREHGIGTLVNPRCRMFSAGDVAKLRRAMRDRPKPSSDEMRRRVMVRWGK